MSYVILDLEWNSVYSRKNSKYLNEIFEFGAVKLDGDLRVIDTFRALVRPVISKEINPYVARLTSVKFEDIEDAPYIFETALDEFADFLGDSVLMTWSTSDILALMDNKKYFMSSKNIEFIKSYCDLQRYCEYALGVASENRKLKLSACAELLEIEIGESLHSAYYDAQLAAVCFKKLYKEQLISEFVDTSKDLYKKLTFKTKYLKSLKNLGSANKNMFFDCPVCNTRCIQKTKWNIKNQSFNAYFICPECKKEYSGKVRVKEKYEGIVFSKSLIEMNKNIDE